MKPDTARFMTLLISVFMSMVCSTWFEDAAYAFPRLCFTLSLSVLMIEGLVRLAVSIVKGQR